ncbi:MAG: hypothetical protein KAQ91_03215 [Methylococcales bacterium]|nr:hypothetical protein [Methylococcales bacterium]
MQQQRCYLFFLLCIGLVGCSSTIDFRGRNKFEPRIKAFAYAIRWSQFEDAQGFIRMRNNRPQQQSLDYLKQIKVTKYQPLKEARQENTDQQTPEILSTYTIDYYHKENYKMKHQSYQQLWWYDDTVGAWFLDSDLPKFGQ